jgi:hypothetical protein
VRTTASASSVAYKQQIADQLATARQLNDGPVRLQVASSVGSRRNWLNLWKPTIDALGALLGRTDPTRPWHPRDGRIVELGLHRQMDTALGHEVVMAISATVLG